MEKTLDLVFYGGKILNINLDILKPKAVVRVIICCVNVINKSEDEKLKYKCRRILDIACDKLYLINFTKEDYPFSTVTYSTPTYYSKKIQEKYNLKFNIHQARHFFASLLIDSGFSILEVQKILGHSSVKITVDTYGHLIKNWDIERFNRIEFYRK